MLQVHTNLLGIKISRHFKVVENSPYGNGRRRRTYRLGRNCTVFLTSTECRCYTIELTLHTSTLISDNDDTMTTANFTCGNTIGELLPFFTSVKTTGFLHKNINVDLVTTNNNVVVLKGLKIARKMQRSHSFKTEPTSEIFENRYSIPKNIE